MVAYVSVRRGGGACDGLEGLGGGGSMLLLGCGFFDGGFLEEGDEDGELLGGVLRAADGREEVLHRAGGDAAELAALAEDGVGLAGAGLAIGEDAGVVAFEDVVDLCGQVSCGNVLCVI